jgi:2-phosphosulfolactate phosphatase
LKTRAGVINILLGERGVEEAALHNDVVVVVDVLRAASTIITALDNGATSIIPTLSIRQAREITRRTPDSVLAGERKAFRIRGFLLGNSPLEYTPEKVRGKNVVLTTTNCTRILERCRKASACSNVLVGAFLNATSVSEAAWRLGRELKSGISIIQAGVGGNPSQDDLTCAEMIKTIIESKVEGRPALTFRGETNLLLYTVLSNTKHGGYLIRMGFGRDVDYCSQLDITTTVPKLCKVDRTMAKIVKG